MKEERPARKEPVAADKMILPDHFPQVQGPKAFRKGRKYGLRVRGKEIHAEDSV